MMFVVIIFVLIVGVYVERIKFSSYIFFILLWVLFVYNFVVYWVWVKGGWLKNIGVLDFVGGIVVYIIVGVLVLVLLFVLRLRKDFGKV